MTASSARGLIRASGNGLQSLPLAGSEEPVSGALPCFRVQRKYRTNHLGIANQQNFVPNKNPMVLPSMDEVFYSSYGKLCTSQTRIW